MDDQSHQRLTELYLRVCDLPPAQRAAALDEACRDEPALRAEVEALLEHDRHSPLPSLDVAASAGDHAPAVPTPALRRIAGYEIIERIGEGGMGTVWKARQIGPHRLVALKILRAAAFLSPRTRARFEREIELAAQLQHPNIARIYDSGSHDGVDYYAMELVDGVDLSRYAAEHKLDARQVLRLMHTVCSAVQHAHERGIIHRDLKPSNIIVSDDGQPHVVDFGLAKTILSAAVNGGAGAGAGELTLSTQENILGTPAFMSPEQASGRTDDVNTRSDVYSLGVILYRLLTGQSPHDLSGSHFEVVRRIAESDPIPPRRIAPWIDGELDALLHKAMARDPRERYSNAGELAQDIHNYLTGAPLSARGPSVIYLMRKSLRRYRTLVVSGAAAVMLIVLGTSFYVWSMHRERARTAAAADRAEALAYASGVQLAHQALHAGQHVRARQLLEDCPPRLRGWEWGYLSRRLGAEDHSVLSVDGFKQWIEDVSFSPDGMRFVVALSKEDGEPDEALVLMHDAKTGAQLLALRGHSDSVYTAEYTPDGKQIITGSRDRTIRTFDAHTGELIATESTAPEGIVFDHRFSPDGRTLATAGYKFGLRIVREGKLLHWIGREREIGQNDCLAFSPDGARVAWSFRSWRDNTGYVWIVDVESGRVIAQWTRSGDPFWFVRFTSDGREVVSGGNRSISFWDATSGQLTRSISVPGQQVRDAVPIDEGRRVLASVIGQIQVWDARSGARLGELCSAQMLQYARIALSPDGARLASPVLFGKEVKVWSLKDFDDGVIARHAGRANRIALSRDGALVASTGHDGKVMLHELPSRRLRWSASGEGAAISVIFSADGSRVAVGRGSMDLRRSDPPLGNITIYDTRDGRVIWQQPTAQRPWSIDFSPDGHSLAAALTPIDSNEREYGGVVMLDATDGSERWSMPGGAWNWARSVHFSGDGHELAIRTHQSLKIVSPETGKVLRERRGDRSGDLLRFLRNGRCVSSIGQQVVLLDPADLSPTDRFALQYTPRAAALHPRQPRLAVAADPTIDVWDIERKRLVLTLEQPANAEVTDVLFTPDGTTLLSGHADGTVRMWHGR